MMNKGTNIQFQKSKLSYASLHEDNKYFLQSPIDVNAVIQLITIYFSVAIYNKLV